MKNLIVIFVLSLLMFACNKEETPVPDGFVRGVVLETMDGGGYTYMRCDVNDTETWVAGVEMKVAVGDTIYYNESSMVMPEFESKSMGKKFENIVFADKVITDINSLSGGSNPHGGMMGGGMMGGKDNHQGASSESKIEGISINPVEGGLTIEQVYAKKDELAGQTVKVIGQVTKYNEAIMNKNWLHIQDGSGSDNNFDLVITTNEAFKVGDIVAFEGVLVVDKDFGAGYKYSVLVEEAKSITKAMKNS